MATDRVMVQLLGGPFDGDRVMVPLESDGMPPLIWRTAGIGPVDLSIPPFRGPQAGTSTQFYRREERVGPDGPVWVYVLTQDDLDQAA